MIGQLSENFMVSDSISDRVDKDTLVENSSTHALQELFCYFKTSSEKEFACLALGIKKESSKKILIKLKAPMDFICSLISGEEVCEVIIKLDDNLLLSTNREDVSNNLVESFDFNSGSEEIHNLIVTILQS